MPRNILKSSLLSAILNMGFQVNFEFPYNIHK